jgi:hypothetical protein
VKGSFAAIKDYFQAASDITEKLRGVELAKEEDKKAFDFILSTIKNGEDEMLAAFKAAETQIFTSSSSASGSTAASSGSTSASALTSASSGTRPDPISAKFAVEATTAIANMSAIFGVVEGAIRTNHADPSPLRAATAAAAAAAVKASEKSVSSSAASRTGPDPGRKRLIETKYDELDQLQERLVQEMEAVLKMQMLFMSLGSEKFPQDQAELQRSIDEKSILLTHLQQGLLVAKQDRDTSNRGAMRKLEKIRIEKDKLERRLEEAKAKKEELSLQYCKLMEMEKEEQLR